MAAILNFSEILNKLPIHLHIVVNVSVRFGQFLMKVFRFCPHKKL